MLNGPACARLEPSEDLSDVGTVVSGRSLSTCTSSVAAYQCRAIGKYLPASKLKHSWAVHIDEGKSLREVQLELQHSRFSGRKRLLLDGNEVFQTRRRSLLWSHNDQSGARLVLRSEGSGFQLSCEDAPIDYAPAGSSPAPSPRLVPSFDDGIGTDTLKDVAVLPSPCSIQHRTQRPHILPHSVPDDDSPKAVPPNACRPGTDTVPGVHESAAQMPVTRASEGIDRDILNNTRVLESSIPSNVRAALLLGTSAAVPRSHTQVYAATPLVSDAEQRDAASQRCPANCFKGADVRREGPVCASRLEHALECALAAAVVPPTPRRAASQRAVEVTVEVVASPHRKGVAGYNVPVRGMNGEAFASPRAGPTSTPRLTGGARINHYQDIVRRQRSISCSSHTRSVQASARGLLSGAHVVSAPSLPTPQHLASGMPPANGIWLSGSSPPMGLIRRMSSSPPLSSFQAANPPQVAHMQMGRPAPSWYGNAASCHRRLSSTPPSWQPPDAGHPSPRPLPPASVRLPGSVRVPGPRRTLQCHHPVEALSRFHMGPW